MKIKACILIVCVFSIFSCTQKPILNESTLTGKLFLLENVEIFEDLTYHNIEFLENNRYIYEFSIDSTTVLQTGYWDSFNRNDSLFVIIEELERLDTFPVTFLSESRMKLVNKLGDTLHFKLKNVDTNFENSLLFEKKWFCLNDSFTVSFDTMRNDFNYKHSALYLNENGKYWFLYRDTLKGNWKFNTTNEIILLDSLKENRELIKIQKLTIDTLFFWKRNERNDMKLFKYAKSNSV